LPNVGDALLLASERASASRPCAVWVAAGIYNVYDTSPSDTVMLRSHVALIGGFAGFERSLQARNVEAYETVLDGTAAAFPTVRVNNVVTGASDSSIDGFTIRNGAALGGGGLLVAGGGMLNSSVSNVVVSSCRFVANRSYYNGGAVANLTSTGLVFRACTFVGNESGHLELTFNQGSGAAMYNEQSTVLVESSLFASNHSFEHAGAMFNIATNAILRNSLVVGNSGDVNGGAIHLYSGSITKIEGCTFGANVAGDSGGAIVNNLDTSHLSVVDTILWFDFPGEIVNWNGASSEVTYSVVTGGAASCVACTWGIGAVDDDPRFPDRGGGSWTQAPIFDWSTGTTTLTDSNATWVENRLAGLLVSPDIRRGVPQYPIVANTPTGVTILGDASDVAAAGASYKLFDYHPSAASSALIDKGGSGLASDFADRPRVCLPSGAFGCPDIGAYEYIP
jgi:hypothetical protein